MAGEFGGPPGIPEFSAPKDDDSSEKKKSVFGFSKRREGEDQAAKAEAAAEHAETDDDDDEKDGNWFRMLSKKFGGSVAVESAESEDDQSEAEAEVETDSEPAEVSELAAEPAVEAVEISPYSFAEEVSEDLSIPEFTAESEPASDDQVEVDISEDATESEEEVPETSIPALKPIETTPVFEDSAEVESEDDEPEPVAQPQAPTQVPEMPQIVAETPEDTESEEEDIPVSNNNDEGGGAGLTDPNILTVPAPEALPPAPDKSKTNNALPAVALGVGLYAHHRINKARNEVERQVKAAREAESALKKEQIYQKAEMDKMRWNPDTAPAAWAPVETAPPAAAKEAQPEKPQEVQPKPQIEQAPQNTERRAEKPKVTAEQKKEQPEATIPSVGELLAERKTSLKTPEVVAVQTPEQFTDTLLKPELEDKTAEVNMQQIESLAELGVAIENQYEKQHEAKDVSSAPGDVSSGGAGPVNAQQLFQKDDPSVTASLQSTRKELVSLRESLDLRDPTNRQAIKMGTFMALAIIIVVMLWSIIA